MFRITGGKGFLIKFTNGWGVRVQFGVNNYCENRDLAPHCSRTIADREAGERGCENAEVAILNPGDGLVYREEWGDEVKGFCSPAEVLELMYEVSHYEDTPEVRAQYPSV